MIFAWKKKNLRNNCPQKYLFTNFWGYAYVPPSPTPMLTGKRQYAAQKRITRQAKVKQTSGPQTVKTYIKSFFAVSLFVHVFTPPFRRFNFAFYTMSVFAFSHFAFYTCPKFMSRCRYRAVDFSLEFVICWKNFSLLILALCTHHKQNGALQLATWCYSSQIVSAYFSPTCG